jgi:hypothetical protein
MGVRPGKAHWLLWLAATLVTVGAGYAVWRQRYSVKESPEPVAFPVPPYSASKYLNTGPEARYVGIAVCAECHPKKHQSYRLTPHSRALSDLDPKLEPPDGEFFHKASGRSYRVYREGGQLRHEEVLRTAEGKAIARVDVPIRYLIGSGHFCRSYLVEIEGALYESPITYYTSRKQWDMSPGYDKPRHWGFERAIDTACLFCHAGRVEGADGSVHRVSIHEKAIGCESCHGPGSLHEELHRAKKHVAGTEDLTIVNPGKLSRPLLESICAHCHLNGPASIPVRGRMLTDYHPGMPLTDYRIDYHFDRGQEEMTVVGHIEQLRRSACYQKSKELNCLTCHDPHASELPKDSVAFYRQKCLSCHAEQGCKLDRTTRLKKEPADNCAACHMPRGDTDIPHIAFTHHRIGRHTKERHEGVGSIPNLVPTDDCTQLRALEQKRNLGLAYAAVAVNGQYSRYLGVFNERARELLEEVRAVGLREGKTANTLAGIYFFWRNDPVRAIEFAREAIEANDATTEERATALTVLANREMHEGNFASAGQRLEELTRLRRAANDWSRLGACYLKENQLDRALPALETALSIQPYLPVLHANLARVYDKLGKLDRAGDHRARAQWLSQYNQK